MFRVAGVELLKRYRGRQLDKPMKAPPSSRGRINRSNDSGHLDFKSGILKEDSLDKASYSN